MLEQGSVKAEVLEETNEASKETDNASLADDGELPVEINGESTTGKADAGSIHVIVKVGMFRK